MSAAVSPLNTSPSAIMWIHLLGGLVTLRTGIMTSPLEISDLLLDLLRTVADMSSDTVSNYVNSLMFDQFEGNNEYSSANINAFLSSYSKRLNFARTAVSYLCSKIVIFSKPISSEVRNVFFPPFICHAFTL